MVGGVFKGLLVSLVALTTLGNVEATSYKFKEKVEVLVNKIGPFNNFAETFNYYSLPFCKPSTVTAKSKALGQAMAGDIRETSLYDIRFGVEAQWQSMCKKELTPAMTNQFIDAIDRDFSFELLIDELSTIGFVGEVEKDRSGTPRRYLYTHFHFVLAYNADNVIAVNLTTFSAERVELKPHTPTEIEFSFSVSWKHTAVQYHERQNLHRKSSISEQPIELHWLSIINSLVLVVLLVSLLVVILMNVLKNDFARYMEIDEEFADEEMDSGWKLIHGDVFRPPAYLSLFTALIGSGTQLFCLVSFLLFLACVGVFYPGNRGAVFVSAVVGYALTAGFGGYTSSSLYQQFGGKAWLQNSLLVCGLFVGPLLFIFSIVNSMAWSAGSSAAMPFGTIMVVICVYSFITIPLTIAGAIRGRLVGPYETPCKTNQIRRQVPEVPFWKGSIVTFLLAGILPFSAIYIELHYIFVSVWGHEVYTLFGILLLVFLILIVVTAAVTVALVYFQLASEDYNWWWRSFLSASSTGAFIWGYAFYYYHYQSAMSGPLQAAFFFGYTFLISYFFGLLLGAVGFAVAHKFVHHIYASIKID